MATRVFGKPIRRNEDLRLVRGMGSYLDDVETADPVHVAFLRSPHAHARISSVDVSVARALPGVVGVYLHGDLGEHDIELPLMIPHPCMPYPRTQRLLAKGEVHYVGQTIAMVVAESRYVAEDAVELIDVDYDLLPAVVDLERALEAGAPTTHSDSPGNVGAHLVQVVGDPDEAFARADVVFTERIEIERSAGQSMETRGVLASYDPRTRELSVWDTTQAPLTIKGSLGSLFGIPYNKVRVKQPDMGGGFGTKVMFYPDEILVPWASIQLGRPVKYVEDRIEHFLGSTHERKQVHELELAATKDGEVLALRDRFLHDTGAYIPYGIAIAQVAATQLPGPYRVPSFRVEFTAVYTNTVPVTPYRGCGRPQACLVIERAMDRLADEIGVDRAEIRRRNYICPEEFPYRRGDILFADGLPVTLDSGSYEAQLDTLLDAIGWHGFREEQAAARAEGRRIGIGLANYVEGTGLGPYEGAHVQVEPTTGKVWVATGLVSIGQGLETSLAQIAAEELGVDTEDVLVVTGDTQAMPWGVATFASRAAVVSGNAVAVAAGEVRRKALRFAANMLEAAEDDLVLEGGRVFVKGAPDRFVTLKQVAIASNPLRYAFDADARAATQFAPARRSDGPQLPEGEEPGLESVGYYSPPHATWASGAHAAVVEVDEETGELRYLRYAAVHDCGTMINPMIVEGQVMGGVAQGIGGAFYERMAYDQDGQLRNASFMDFLIPYATEVPPMRLEHLETPSPLNPKGIKGAGEAGCIPVPALTAAAIDDALADLGVRVRSMPLDPCSLKALIDEARAARA
ncbi:MAG: aerobic carbon-monoxide dehydrogenase large subunit [Thermoleophilia bacterium]